MAALVAVLFSGRYAYEVCLPLSPFPILQSLLRVLNSLLHVVKSLLCERLCEASVSGVAALVAVLLSERHACEVCLPLSPFMVQLRNGNDVLP